MATPIYNATLVDCVLAFRCVFVCACACMHVHLSCHFSQFSDLEREHLIRFSKSLGAV